MSAWSPGQAAEAGTIRLLLVGDVHGFWDPQRDAALVRALRPDCTLFLGDFGEEVEELVARVAECPGPRAVILGNHDAWYSLTSSQARRRLDSKPPDSQEADLDWVYGGARRQMQALGPDHVGWASKRLPAQGGGSFSIVGARPFSKGGGWSWKNIKDFYKHFYQVENEKQAAERTAQVLRSVPRGEPVILAAHSGPTGLGRRRHDPCGVDFRPDEGDFGDPDLSRALRLVGREGGEGAPPLAPPPLVAFGHMHQGLQGGGLRNMAHIDGATGTVYLNAAFVPRILPLSHFDARPSSPESRTAHAFVVVLLRGGAVASAQLQWLEEGTCQVVGGQPVVETVSDLDGVLVRRAFQAHGGHWGEPVAWRRPP